MDFIFDHHDLAIVRRVGNQFIGLLQLDVVSVTTERIHQVGAPTNNARPAEIIENLIDRVVGDD